MPSPEVPELALIDQLGIRMVETLPFEPGNFALRAFGASLFTEKTLFPVEVDTDDEIYRRVWLERRAAKREADSAVQLLADYVVVDPKLDNQANQFARHGREIARTINGVTTLESQLPEPVTITDMIDWVGKVALAEKLKQIRKAVPLTHIRLDNRPGLDSVPGLQF